MGSQGWIFLRIYTILYFSQWFVYVSYLYFEFVVSLFFVVVCIYYNNYNIFDQRPIQYIIKECQYVANLYSLVFWRSAYPPCTIFIILIFLILLTSSSFFNVFTLYEYIDKTLLFTLKHKNDTNYNLELVLL